MRFLLPTGIGDSVWALHKVEAIRDARDPGGRIDISLACGSGDSPVESRALDFVRRFRFVDSAEMRPGLMLLRDPAFTPDGYWNYIDDGLYDFGGESFCVLVPNAALERGIRLDAWLPHHATRWDVMDDFRIRLSEREFADDIARRVGPFCVFYPGPLDGNTVQGHNRNMLWRPADWLALGERIHREFGLAIVVVGAPYDAAYYDALLAPRLNGASGYWHSLIGATSIGQLYATTSRARFCVSYQAGVGIVATLLGTPTAIFWRARGDSICADGFLSFEESMSSAWVPPSILTSGGHLPCFYGRDGVDDIMQAATQRGWAK